MWELVARPGWYINDGTVEAESDLRYEGDVAIVTQPGVGEFRFRTVQLDKPRYAAFRWMGTPFRASSEGTLVEFETYWTTRRGVEAMDNSYGLLDLTVSSDELA